jgi:lipopolysaccharide transport system permease protein
LASVLSGVVDFALAFIVLVGMMIYYGVHPTDAIWTLPLFLLLALVTSLGVGLWLSALNVQYRDVGYVTPFLLQAWMYASPVGCGSRFSMGDPGCGGTAFGIDNPFDLGGDFSSH